MITEAVARRCSVKKTFLEISQNSQKTPALFFNKVAGRPVNFAKSLRTPLTEYLGWLLL